LVDSHCSAIVPLEPGREEAQNDLWKEGISWQRAMVRSCLKSICNNKYKNKSKNRWSKRENSKHTSVIPRELKKNRLSITQQVKWGSFVY
jgi:hypothetical protein